MTLTNAPRLETERLILRGPEMADAEPVIAFLLDPERSAGFGGYAKRDDAWRWWALNIGHWHIHGYGYLTIEDKETGKPAGICGIWNPEGWPEPELGWVVFEGFEGKSIAFEAATAARKWAYDTNDGLGFTTLTSNIVPDNARSIKLAERLGATFERAYDNVNMGLDHLYRHPAPDALDTAAETQETAAAETNRRHEQAPTGVPAALASGLASQIPTLVTDALTLRAPRTEDFDAYAQILCAERGRFVYPNCTRMDAWYDFAQLTATWLLHGHGGWTITDTDTDETLGFVLLGLEPCDEQIELGFMLTEENEGMGIAHEAAQMARQFAFDTLKLPELVSYIHKDNARSIALAERLGATRTLHKDPMLAYIHTNEAAQ